MLYLDILIIHLTEDIRFLYLSTFYAFYTLLLFIDYPYISTIFLVVLIVLLHLLSPKIASALIFLSVAFLSYTAPHECCLYPVPSILWFLAIFLHRRSTLQDFPHHPHVHTFQAILNIVLSALCLVVQIRLILIRSGPAVLKNDVRIISPYNSLFHQ